MKAKQRKEWVIGLFTLTVLILLVGSYIYLKGENVFKPVSRYYVKFDNVDGLYVGNRVMLNGLGIGKVSSMQYTGRAGEAILVELQVSPDFKLSSTARAGIINSGLIGGRVVKLFDAVGSGPFLNNNDTIPGRTEGALAESLEETVGPLIVRVDTLIQGLTVLTSHVNGLMTEENTTHVSEIVANLSVTAGQLAGASKKLQPILSNVDVAIGNVSSAAVAADSAIGGANQIIDSLRRIDFGAAVASLEKASQSADSLLMALQRGEGTAGKLLKDDEIYRQAQSAIASLDSLVTDIKRNPKRYIRISVF